MLHTLFTIENSKMLELTNNHYNIFDPRTFVSDQSLEGSFNRIVSNFIRRWNNSVKPFIDGIIKKDKFYEKEAKPIFTVEEAIFMKAEGIDPLSIRCYQINNGLRLFAVKDMKYNFCFVDSLHYSNIKSNNNVSISLFINEKAFYKVEDEELNNSLIKLLNSLAMKYMDRELHMKHNVPLNYVYNANEFDAIILPERASELSSLFVYLYYDALFTIIQSLTNCELVKTFDDYSKSNVYIPSMFPDLEEDIFEEIWNIAHKKILAGTIESVISDDEYINICAKIYNNIGINIDEDFYELASQVYQNMEEEEDNA